MLPSVMNSDDRIMIVAGEASADAHAAAVVRELKKLRPKLEVFGVGGRALRNEGADLIFDFSRTGVVGITEVLPEIPKFLSAYRALLKEIRQRPPRGVILLDLPDFNLFLAGKIRKHWPGLKIIYYISPQVWAWRRGRVKKIAQRADAMLVLFPFEVELYRTAGMDVEFVGHPLKDTVKPTAEPDSLRREFGLSGAGPVIALLPGSRRAELDAYLPVMTEFADFFSREQNDAAFLLALAPTLQTDQILSRLGARASRLRIIPQRLYDVLAVADLAVAASGTVTLEAALMETPMVVLGKVSPLTYAIVKPLTTVPYYSLPNVIAGRQIVPELIQRQANPRRLLAEVKALLHDTTKREQTKMELRKVRDALGPPGASTRAAAAIQKRLW